MDFSAFGVGFAVWCALSWLVCVWAMFTIHGWWGLLLLVPSTLCLWLLIRAIGWAG